MAKIETIADAVATKAIRHLMQIVNLPENDPIIETAAKQIRFSVRMWEGKRRAKARRMGRPLPLFK
jgi:hypothetical protein